VSASSALQGLKVVDLGIGMPAALAAQLLAGAGAEVRRIEPPGGDPFAEIYPAYAIWRRDEIVDSQPFSQQRLDELLADADVCIIGGEDYPGLARPVSAEALSAAHPKLVVLDISGYPAGAGGESCPAVDILAQARSGLAFEHYSDRPIQMTFEPGNYGAALHGLIGILAALLEREESGRGQVVSSTLFEGALTYGGYFWAQMDNPTPAATFVIPKDPYPPVLQCADGKYVHLVLGSAGSKYKLYKVLGIDDPSVDPNDSGLPQLGVPPRKFFGDVDLLGEYTAKFKRDELLSALWAEGIPAEAVFAPGECWDEEQIAQSGLIQRDAQGRRFVGMPMTVRWAAGNAGARAARSAGDKGPLAGVRIIDLGAFVAGPYASTVLADLGADVVKVEAPPAGDPNRSSGPSFVSANRGKRAIVVNLKSGDGQTLVKNLCHAADVVMNNFRTGVSSRLGVDAASLHRDAPHLVVLENSAFGPTGPKAMNGGFDPIIQAYSGVEHRSGGEDNPPLWGRTVMVDYTAGLLGALSILMGLYHRAKHGSGAEINMPLVNAGIFLSSDLVQQADGKFSGFAPLNRTQTGRHPAECLYATADGWIAVAARDAAMARRLAQALGLEAQLSTDRALWAQAEHDIIAAAMASRSTAQVLGDLRKNQVWAEPCKQDAFRDYFKHEGLLARGTLWTEQNEELGEVKRIGQLVAFSRSQTTPPRTSPRLGEHTREILREAGVAESDIQRYLDEGVVFSD